MAKTSSIPLGWCMTGLHDTDEARGACPIAVGSVGPCPCECHDGETEARDFLPSEAQPLITAEMSEY